MMQASATQVGPERWAARVHANGVCVYNNPRFTSLNDAVADAQDEIGRRENAVVEAQRLVAARSAREQALRLVRHLASTGNPEAMAIIADMDAAPIMQAAE